MICSRDRLCFPVAFCVALCFAGFCQADPPGTYRGQTYPHQAAPLYPGYRPSANVSPPGTYSTSGINHYQAYIPGANYSPLYEPGIAQSYARIGPSGNPMTTTTTRFYIPSVLLEGGPGNVAHLEVFLPRDAELWINDWKAHSTGMIRDLQSPALDPAHQYVYRVRAIWKENGREVTRTQEVPVSAGAFVRIDFLRPPPKK